MSAETEPRQFPWRLFLASLAALLSLAAIGLSIAWRVHTSNEIRKQTAMNCRQIENLKVAITANLVDSRNDALRRTTDSTIMEALNTYYDRQLARFAPDDCPNP